MVTRPGKKKTLETYPGSYPARNLPYHVQPTIGTGCQRIDYHAAHQAKNYDENDSRTKGFDHIPGTYLKKNYSVITRAINHEDLVVRNPGAPYSVRNPGARLTGKIAGVPVGWKVSTFLTWKTITPFIGRLTIIPPPLIKITRRCLVARKRVRSRWWKTMYR